MLIASERILLRIVLSCVLGCIALTLVSCGGTSAATINGLSALAPVTVTLSPPTATVATNNSQMFTAIVNNTGSTAVSWLINGLPSGAFKDSSGNVSYPFGQISGGMYTAPAFVPAPGTFMLTAAASADNTAMANATLTITGPLTPGLVSVSPPTASLFLGGSVAFTATVNDVPDPLLVWSVNGVPGGDLSVGTITPIPGSASAALYIAPLALQGLSQVAITASYTNNNSTQSASATVMLSQAPPGDNITISPSVATVQTNQTQNFTASVSGVADGVVWQVDGIPGGNASVGMIAGSGDTATYTAPSVVPDPPTLEITAASTALPGLQASASISITQGKPIVVTVTPPKANVVINGTQQFLSMVENATDQTVTWEVNGIVGGNSDLGTISNASSDPGLYTAPATVPNPATVTISAVSNQDHKTKGTATATIGLTAVVTISIDPSTPQTLPAGGLGLPFAATIMGTTGDTLTWEIDGQANPDPSLGSIQVTSTDTLQATYLSPQSIPSPATVQISAVDLMGNTSNVTPVTITMQPPPIQVTIAPVGPTDVIVGQSQPFSATITGTNDLIVHWSLSGPSCSGASCGTITPDQSTLNATYVAPQNVPSPNNAVTVTVSADADPSVKASGTVDVVATAMPSISISPNPATVPAGLGQSLTFTVTVSNANPDSIISYQLYCISDWDGQPEGNCQDVDFVDGPGCITPDGGFQTCGERPNQGQASGGTTTVLYNPPESVSTQSFEPNQCANTDPHSSIVPLTASISAQGCPQGVCTTQVCITVTP